MRWAWMLVAAPVVIGASLRTHFDALPVALALGGLLALLGVLVDVGALLGEAEVHERAMPAVSEGHGLLGRLDLGRRSPSH